MSKTRTITPNPPADFVPEHQNIRPFRAWCQKVLPLVYDDSLSYYELLCKVLDTLNKTVCEVLNLGDAYDKLEEYVNHYFDNLDVQEEINNKLDEMLQNGELAQILTDAIQKYHCGYVNIRNYGAKCDGVTDDSDAIQAAVNALNTLDDNGISRRVLVIPAFTVITKQINVPFGLFKIKGYSLNESRIICKGDGCFVIGGDEQNHEVEIEDIYFRGDSQNSFLIKINKVSNITFTRLHVSHCGANCYSVKLDNCGIININKCIIEGGEDVEALPGNRNGLWVNETGSQVNITECNVWNLKTFLTLTGTIQQVNIYKNWIECVKRVIELQQTQTDLRYMHYNIHENFINIHNYSGFVLDDDFSLLHMITFNTAEIFNTVVSIKNNQIYLWNLNAIENNSLVTIDNSIPSSIVYFAYEGNILTGKTLYQLNSYVFKKSTNVEPHFIEFKVTNNQDYLQYSDNSTVAGVTVGRTSYYSRIIDRLEFMDYTDSTKFGSLRFGDGSFYTNINGVNTQIPIRIPTNVINGLLTGTESTTEIIDRLNQLTTFCAQSLLFILNN